MNTPSASSAESPAMQDAMNWPEFLLIGFVTLTLVALVIAAPRRRGRMLLVTDVLR